MTVYQYMGAVMDTIHVTVQRHGLGECVDSYGLMKYKFCAEGIISRDNLGSACDLYSQHR